MKEPERDEPKKVNWRVFAGVPDENAAYLMCSFLQAAGLHPVIERTDTLAHYGISSMNGCRVLLPDHEHGIALEAYAKVVVMPPNSAELAFESADRGDEDAPNADNGTNGADGPLEAWREADPESWKSGRDSPDEVSGWHEPGQDVVPDTGSQDPEDQLDLPREQWTQRERDADDAFDLSRVGIFGVFAMPRVLYLLWRVRNSSERLRPSLRSRAIRAAWIGVPLFALYFVLLPAIFGFACYHRS